LGVVPNVKMVTMTDARIVISEVIEEVIGLLGII